MIDKICFLGTFFGNHHNFRPWPVKLGDGKGMHPIIHRTLCLAHFTVSLILFDYITGVSNGIWNCQQLDNLFNSLLRLKTKQTSKLHSVGLFWRKSSSDPWIPLNDFILVDCFTLFLHDPNSRQITFCYCCARGLSVAAEKWKSSLSTWVHSPLQLRKSQRILRPTHHKNVMPAN